jgi:hypothetical protein
VGQLWRLRIGSFEHRSEPVNVATRKCRRLAVAIRAQHPQVLPAVIVFYSVDMIEMYIERLTAPIAKAAQLTAVLKKSSIN